MERHIAIRHESLDLIGTIHYPVRDEAAVGKGCTRVPLIVICHGFVGNRIGVDRLFLKTARSLAAEGYMVLRFDYGGCGESSGEYGELGLDAMIEQTRTVLDYGLDIENVDPTRVTLIGHSLGGAVAVLTAARDKRVKTLVLWSAVAYPFNDIVKIVGRDKYDESVKTGQTDYLGYSFKPEYFDSLSRHQPFQQAVKFSGDVLLVHGTSDDVIPADYSFLYQKLLWMRQEGQCDKEIIFQADHTYSSGPHQQRLIKITKQWLGGLDKRHGDWLHWTI